RRERSGGQLAQDGLGDCSNLRIRAVYAGSRLKIDLYNRGSIYGRGFDVLDVVNYRGEHTLVHGCDSPFHLLRAESRVCPGHSDDRNIDAREDVGRRPQNHNRTQNENEKRQDNECVRSVKSESDNPHLAHPEVSLAYLRNSTYSI